MHRVKLLFHLILDIASFFQKEISQNGLPKGCTAVVNVAGENILNPMKR